MGIKFSGSDAGGFRFDFSGANSDPTDTGEKPGASREDLGLSDVGGWVGVADFKAEQSVAGGSTFYSDFNTGHGLQYYVNALFPTVKNGAT